jgi:hypothetical protein
MAKLGAFVRLHCQVVMPDRTAFRRAAELARNPKSGLRAGDALHLAIALALNASNLLCLDDVMVTAARALGLQAPRI